jgi:serine/threonine protein kinase
VYAAPEAVHSWTSGKNTVNSDTAADIFALGVMCFELLTRAPYYPKGSTAKDVGEMLAGLRPLPHENLSETTSKRLGVLKECASSLLWTPCRRFTGRSRFAAVRARYPVAICILCRHHPT